MTLSAFAVYDAIGVRAKPNDPLYRNFKWQALITDELGLRHTRGSIGRSKSDLQYMKPLFDKGVKHCATIVQSASGLDWTAAKANIDGIATIWGPNNISGIEGPNEYNRNHTSGWAAAERDFVKKTHDYVRSIPALAPCNLVAPSIFMRITEDYKALGSIDAYVDRGCLHYYTGAKKPTISAHPIDQCISDAHILTPKPLWVTEVGYDRVAVSERVQAKHLLRVMLELIKRGCERTYIFELFDTMSGHQYGLLTSTLAKRLAFYSVKNLVALLKDVPCVAGAYDVKFSGPSDLVTMVLGKSDGSHLVLMWRDVLSKDADVSSPVTVTLPVPASRIEAYQPTFDASIKQVGSGSSMVVQVPDHVVVLKVMA